MFITRNPEVIFKKRFVIANLLHDIGLNEHSEKARKSRSIRRLRAYIDILLLRNSKFPHCNIAKRLWEAGFDVFKEETSHDIR